MPAQAVAPPQTLQSFPSRAEPSSEPLPGAATAPAGWTLPAEHPPCHISDCKYHRGLTTLVYTFLCCSFCILYVYKYALFYTGLSMVTQSISNTGCFTFLRELLL